MVIHDFIILGVGLGTIASIIMALYFRSETKKLREINKMTAALNEENPLSTV